MRCNLPWTANHTVMLPSNSGRAKSIIKAASHCNHGFLLSPYCICKAWQVQKAFSSRVCNIYICIAHFYTYIQLLCSVHSSSRYNIFNTLYIIICRLLLSTSNSIVHSVRYCVIYVVIHVFTCICK